MGSATDSWRTAQTRDRCRPDHSRKNIRPREDCQAGKTFLRNHADGSTSIDMFSSRSIEKLVNDTREFCGLGIIRACSKRSERCGLILWPYGSDQSSGTIFAPTSTAFIALRKSNSAHFYRPWRANRTRGSRSPDIVGWVLILDSLHDSVSERNAINRLREAAVVDDRGERLFAQVPRQFGSQIVNDVGI